jgi:hypothetical protein
LPAGAVGCRLGCSLSRVSCPSGVGGSAAAASRWNKSSWALPRPVGAPLRHRWRAHGGGSPCLEPLYKSRSAAVHRPWWWRPEPVMCLEDVEVAAGAVDARRTDRARCSRGGGFRRRRAWIQGRGSLGCGPDRCVFSVASYSSMAVSVFCGPFQSLCAMEFPSASGSTAAAGVGVFRRRRRGFLESSARKGSRGHVVIFTFPRAFLSKKGGTAVLCFPVWHTCTCMRLVCFSLTIKAGMLDKKNLHLCESASRRRHAPSPPAAPSAVAGLPFSCHGARVLRVDAKRRDPTGHHLTTTTSGV